MDARVKTFLGKNPYDHLRVAPHFLRAVQANLAYHHAHCEDYARLIRAMGFDPACVQTEKDLWRIPPIPTLFLKKHSLMSMPEEKLVLRATSSGTSGARSAVAFDRQSLLYGIGALTRLFSYLGLPGALPVHYVVLSYPPGEGMTLGASQTANGAMRFAPALSKTYALKRLGPGSYAPDIEGVRAALLRHEKSPFAVRFIGFPAYLHALCRMLETEDIRVRLPRGSLALLGGGFKGLPGAQEAEELPRLAKERLGLAPSRIFEVFSAAEHPLAYYKCRLGRFHIPAYSRVFIRGADGVTPVSDGEAGLLSFLSPLVMSMPLLSVMTDDVAVRAPGGCGCGIESPYFTLLGRAGQSGAITCAAGAGELLLGAKGGDAHV